MRPATPAATVLALMLTALSGRALARTAPELTALSYLPSINTSARPANLIVNYAASDSSSGLNYFEVTFVDPSGAIIRRGSALFSPAPSVSSLVTVAFPQFSRTGTWTIGAVFLADEAGKTQVLNTSALAAANFPTNLQVYSLVDTTPPILSAFAITPSIIDTTSAPVDVTVNFTTTDNLSGANRLEMSFVSPSGAAMQRAAVNLTPATTVKSAATLTFPQGSEAGTWRVAGVFISDAAGNTLALDTGGVAASGFPTTLAVASPTDAASPILTAFNFTPSSINTTSGPVGVTVNFAATDNLSGVRALQVTFLSPSGTSTQQATVSLAPATAVTGSTVVDFPRFSTTGAWTVGSIFLVDAAGNTSSWDRAGLAAKGFPTTLSVTSTTDSTPPTLSALSFAPTSINTASHSANVTLSFHVTDDLSGATTFQAAFVSPSGASTQTAAASFAAATSATGTATTTLPQGSETGTWVLTTVFLADAAGNTTTMSAGDLARRGFATRLTLTTQPGRR